MGHQGASSTRFCIWCLITLADLARSKGASHSPMTKGPDGVWQVNKVFTKRTVEKYREDYANFIADRNNPENPRANGAAHNNIIADMLFPGMINVYYT